MNNFYLMIGLPASGKSTIAEKIQKEEENTIIISTDNLRKELLSDINNQEQNNLIFEEAEKRIKQGFENNQNVIFDATNINYKRRKELLNKFKKYNIMKIAILVATTYEECLKRNSERDRKVPEEVIKRMYYHFYIPQYYEGYDDIRIYYNTEKTFKIEDLEKEYDIPQDNPHHTLSVYNHCKKAYEYIIKNTYNTKESLTAIATLLHDIGKKDTKTFINMKGEKGNIAHYYRHENVGAYKSLFYDLENSLEIAKLIQWHMLPHQDMSEKTLVKYINLLGYRTIEKLKQIHEADLAAK